MLMTERKKIMNTQKTSDEKRQMKFDNLLSQIEYRVALKNAIAEWMLGFDGEGFSTFEVVQCIPWGNDLNAVLPFDKVIYELDLAIGSRGNWRRSEIVGTNEESEDLRHRFWLEVHGKCDAICKVYEKYIDKANAMLAETKHSDNNDNDETTRSIAEEIRRLAYSTQDGIIAINGRVIADRIEAVCRCAYEEIDNAVCSIDSMSSTDIDHIRKIMDETIGDYYE